MKKHAANVAAWLAVFLLMLAASIIRASPIAKAESDKVTITLYSEPCKLKAIKNLPGRAVWLENGKPVEGCYGSDGMQVIFYWNDRTVVVLSVFEFSEMNVPIGREHGTET